MGGLYYKKDIFGILIQFNSLRIELITKYF